MYCKPEEVREMIKEDAINQIIGDEYIEDETVKEEKIQKIIENAIEDADGEIEGYLNSRYPVPLTKVPKIINKISKDIAVFNVFSRIGIDEEERENTILVRYKNAIKFLESISKGVVDIGIKKPEEVASNTFQMSANERLFSRSTLRGM